MLINTEIIESLKSLKKKFNDEIEEGIQRMKGAQAITIERQSKQNVRRKARKIVRKFDDLITSIRGLDFN